VLYQLSYVGPKSSPGRNLRILKRREKFSKKGRELSRT
jgi:hypothetical protein